MAPEPSLRGKRAAVLLFSYYPSDPRPRRAAEALVNDGMQVEVICLKASTEERARETFNGVDILRLPLKRRRGGASAYLLQYSTFILSTFFVLAFRSLSRRYALVHVHNMPDILVLGALVPKALGAKVILDLHDPMPELMRTIFGLEPTSFAVGLLERLERWSIALADLVFTVNLACKKLFASRGCAPDKIHVVMNSPDEGIFAFRPAPPAPSEHAKPFVTACRAPSYESTGRRRRSSTS
jgi:glycosyltransferase involved in cell wall biosynthesis